jgi:N-acetylglucosaminyldiphosphoundecaprenol N-acetyl-beta-D-mannosaminyltransferase
MARSVGWSCKQFDKLEQSRSQYVQEALDRRPECDEQMVPARAVSRIGRLALDVMDRRSAVRHLLAGIKGGREAVVVTPNIHHLRLAQIDASFAAVLERAEYVLADGWPLILASRLLRPSLPERVAGIDLVHDLLQADQGLLRVGVLGGPPGAAGALAQRLRPLHQVVYVEELPRWRADDEPRLAGIAAAISAAAPNLLLIGIGAPRQELLADALRGAVAGPIVCCGAAIEVLGGQTPRAPALLRSLGLEWAFRMAREPRRLGPRYTVSAASFCSTVLADISARAMRGSRLRRDVDPHAVTDTDER